MQNSKDTSAEYEMNIAHLGIEVEVEKPAGLVGGLCRVLRKEREQQLPYLAQTICSAKVLLSGKEPPPPDRLVDDAALIHYMLATGYNGSDCIASHSKLDPWEGQTSLSEHEVSMQGSLSIPTSSLNSTSASTIRVARGREAMKPMEGVTTADRSLISLSSV